MVMSPPVLSRLITVPGANAVVGKVLLSALAGDHVVTGF